jgi:phage terminase large subunit
MAAQNGQSGVILCAREHLNSLDESSLEEVKQAIRSVDWLNDYYEIGEKYIRTKNKLVSYVFAGLRSNLDSIKSKARILIAWIDEGEQVSEIAYQKLMPTVREEGSEVWVTWNPERDGSPTDTRFRKTPPESAKIAEMHYFDNPWFPSTLDAQRIEDQERLDPATYAWIWDGAYLENSDAQVFHGKTKIKAFTPGKDWDGPYFGGDFGFSQDPTAAVECYIHDDTLYVYKEAVKTGLEISETVPFVLAKIPGFDKEVSRWDCARPETVSHIKQHGMPRAESCDKWPGSVEDGIQHLRGYRAIVIHPQCTETQKEARLYSYKVDRLTGDVTSKLVDAYNHCWDAIRYALGPMIKNRAMPKVNIKMN